MNTKNQKNRFLGIDLGRKYVGIAMSDDEGRIAFPREVIGRAGFENIVLELVRSEGISAIIIGLPKELSGEESSAGVYAKDAGKVLVEVLQNAGLTVEIVFVDERFSTANVAFGTTKSLDAHNKNRRSGTNGADIKRKDAEAAAIILQRYLDAR